MPHATVFIVDDDADVRDSVRALLESAGFAVEDYGAALAFLAAYVPRTNCCLIADIRMPGMDGLKLQETLTERKMDIPVIIMTGHGDVPLAVRAMQAGATDFVEKPFNDERLLDSVRKAIAKSQVVQASSAVTEEMQARLARLTAREREVLVLLVAGQPNKGVARALDISPRTVEVFRARIMDKMEARSLAELVHVAIAAGVLAP